MKILILGAKGMLGSMLMRILADYKPTGWDKAELDILNGKIVQQKIGEFKPEVIINCAAYTNVDGAEANRDAAFALNEGAVRTLAIVAKNLNVTLVHYSTDYVFPGDKSEGYTEDNTPGPAVNIYGESKFDGEQALKEIGPNHYLLRTAWLYGPGGKNFVDTMLTLAQTKKTVSVVNDQWGSPTYTQDVAQATKQLLEEKYPYGTYHVVNAGRASWYEVAQHIFKTAQLPVDVEAVSSAEYARPAKRPKYSVLQNTRGPKLRDWQTALDEYLTKR